MSDLERTVLDLVQRSEVPYLVVVDEIDHRFRKTPLYHDVITGLVYAADHLNRSLRYPTPNAKIVVMLRTDICNWLNDVDLNKVKVDARVEIEWSPDDDLRSSLFDLFLKKVLALESGWELKPLSRDDGLRRLFAMRPSERLSVDRYLLSRTLLRPRDLITFLNLAKDERPEAGEFTRALLKKVELRYSRYFLDETKNELKGHINDEMIDHAFHVLAGLGKKRFQFTELEEYLRDRYSESVRAQSKQLLTALFEFSVLGNSFWDQERERVRQRWHYKSSDVGISEIDYNLTIVVHPGLWKVLGLTSLRGG